MAEALYYRVHEARVADVPQTAQPFFPTAAAAGRFVGVVIGAAIVDGLERRRGRKSRTAKSGSVAADARVVVPAAVTYGTGRVDALGSSSRTEIRDFIIVIDFRLFVYHR